MSTPTSSWQLKSFFYESPIMGRLSEMNANGLILNVVFSFNAKTIANFPTISDPFVGKILPP